MKSGDRTGLPKIFLCLHWFLLVCFQYAIHAEVWGAPLYFYNICTFVDGGTSSQQNGTYLCTKFFSPSVLRTPAVKLDLRIYFANIPQHTFAEKFLRKPLCNHSCGNYSTQEREMNPWRELCSQFIAVIGYILKAAYGWQHISMTSFVLLGSERIKNVRCVIRNSRPTNLSRTILYNLLIVFSYIRASFNGHLT